MCNMELADAVIGVVATPTSSQNASSHQSDFALSKDHIGNRKDSGDKRTARPLPVLPNEAPKPASSLWHRVVALEAELQESKTRGERLQAELERNSSLKGIVSGSMPPSNPPSTGVPTTRQSEASIATTTMPAAGIMKREVDDTSHFAGILEQKPAPDAKLQGGISGSDDVATPLSAALAKAEDRHAERKLLLQNLYHAEVLHPVGEHISKEVQATSGADGLLAHPKVADTQSRRQALSMHTFAGVDAPHHETSRGFFNIHTSAVEPQLPAVLHESYLSETEARGGKRRSLSLLRDTHTSPPLARQSTTKAYQLHTPLYSSYANKLYSPDKPLQGKPPSKGGIATRRRSIGDEVPVRSWHAAALETREHEQMDLQALYDRYFMLHARYLLNSGETCPEILLPPMFTSDGQLNDYRRRVAELAKLRATDMLDGLHRNARKRCM